VAKPEAIELVTVEGYELRISNPEKLYFSRDVKLTKLDLVRYFLAIAPGALIGIEDRPIVLKRFVNGAEAEPFYQKRAPTNLPSYLRTATLSFPSGRMAEEVVVDTAAGLAWIVNLGCIELHPHPVRTSDLDHPDQLRVDLDPGPGVDFATVRLVALEANAVLDEMGLVSFPKTSGSRGIHINVPIHPSWTFTEVRRTALALARAVERRVPHLASSKWWKEERHGVFLDYNQNAKDRTTASAYSVRPLPDARVSAPLRWDEVADCDPADFTVITMPARFEKVGDPHATFRRHAGSLESLLQLAARDEAEGLGDAPWPPHFRKAPDEAPRVAPSRARKLQGTTAEPTVAKVPRTRMPMITIANSPDREAALAGLERWRIANPDASNLLAVDDVLVDRMRGRSYVWYRIRVNLRHVPEPLRPTQETPDPDDDPTRGEAKQE
jgi:bifunctional non-homologous end joining protein LigD